MQFEQRAPTSEESFKPSVEVWRPVVILEPDEVEEWLEPSGDEHYVVVEEIVDGLVRLEVSTWPHLDQDGRLHFEGEPWSLAEPVDDLEAAVNQVRGQRLQVGANRPLRVGDVFMVTGLEDGATSLGEAATIVDVSAAARSAAKAALYGAVASAVSEEYAREMAVVGPAEVPEEAGYFDVRQEKLGPREYGSEVRR